MAIAKDVLDRLLAGREPSELFAKDGLLDELKKALSERMLAAELEDHLEAEAEAGAVNRRNGSSKKTVLTGSSRVTLEIPRDRAGTFDPKLIAKYQRRFPDFDAKIVSMYARGLSVREIRGHLEELYGIDPGLRRGRLCRQTSSRRSPTPCSRPSPNGRAGRSTPATPWCFSTRSGSRSGTKALSVTSLS